MEETDLIILHNSTPLNKYPVDADQLNANFKALQNQIGTNSIKDLVESTGQRYSSLLSNQLATAVAQYALSANVFTEVGSGNTYILQGKDGIAAPFKYTDNMVVYFKTEHTNSGASTLQIDTLTEYPIKLDESSSITAGYIVTNQLLGFRFIENGSSSYWLPISSSYSSSSSGGSGEGADSSTVDYIYSSIVNTISSAGLSFNTDNVTLLSKAISTYIGHMLYNCEYESNVYNLTSQNAQVGVTALSDGLIVFFIASETNDNGAAIRINGGYSMPIVDFSNKPIEAESIIAGDFIYCLYTNGSFKLLSNHKATLSLNNGVTVDTITNDVELVNDSSRAIPTEHAVKSYVDTKVKGSTPNIVVDGYAEGTTPAALHNVGAHVVQLVTQDESLQTAWKEVQGSDPDSCIASGNNIYARNVINKIVSTYWESEKIGFSVDGKSRVLAGSDGFKYIVIETDGSGNPVYVSSPCYIGISNLTTLPDMLHIRHSDDNHTPQSIKLQIAFGTDTTFYDVVNNVDGVADYTYGNIQAMQVQANNYYVIQVPTYYLDGGVLRPIIITGGTTFKLRVVPTLFDRQFPTEETINSQGYDPNNDTESTTVKYTWQVVDIILSSTVSSPAFTLSYPDNSIEAIHNMLYVSQYEVVEPEEGQEPDPNLTALDEIDDGLYYFYKIYNEPMLYLVAEEAVYTQISDPLTPEQKIEDNAGSVWINTSTIPSTTYILSEVNTNTYDWQQSQIMLLGACQYANNGISVIDTFRYSNAFGVEFPMTSDFDQTITHNFGTDVLVECYLVCTTANNGYSAGEEISIDNNITSLENPQLFSYFQAVNTKLQTRITAHNLLIINRTTHEPVVLPNTGWTLRVYITKD